MADLKHIEHLIGRVALRDRKAFMRLYDVTSAKLLGVCLRVLKDRAEAEDVLQEVFVKIWQRAGRYQVNGLSPMTWLITIARNASIDKLRARRAGETPIEDIADVVADPAPGPEATAVAQSEASRINACLDGLEGRRSEAVRGAYLQGETYAELAARFGVPVNTMRTWLRRSLISLRECLDK